MKKVEMVKITLKIGDSMFELSLEEAKELKATLDKVFCEKEIQYVPTYPYYPPYEPCRVWYGSTTGSSIPGTVSY